MISPAFVRRNAIPTSWCTREPTLREILSDSIVIAVMAADGVDPKALEAQLLSMARRSPPAD
jgi:hypothetical protein